MDRTVYVKAKSKKDLNAALDAVSTDIDCREYGFHGFDMVDIYALPVGTVVKVFQTTVAGNPVARSYGTVGRDKQGRMIVR